MRICRFDDDRLGLVKGDEFSTSRPRSRSSRNSAGRSRSAIR
jgi:hypothetical protein